MTYKVLRQKVTNFETSRASLALLMIAAMLGGACGSSNTIYPGAEVYDKQKHGIDQGNIALMTCTNLSPIRIRKKVELQIQSYVTSDPIESVKSWYAKKLSDWGKVGPGDAAKREECPNGVSYVFPEQCKDSGDCTRQIYVLEKPSDKTWIVVITLK
jgi:hypothetical protein